MEPFLLKSAYELSYSEIAEEQAQILAESEYDSFYWIEIIRADP